MFKAAENGDIETIKRFLDDGANINTILQGKTMLMLSALSSDPYDTIQFLIERGADLDVVDDEGKTALMLVAINGDHSGHVVDWLVRGGANMDAKDLKENTALMYSAIFGNFDITITLIKEGADVSVKNGAGVTALMFASMNDNTSVDVFRTFFENGARANEKSDSNVSAFMFLLQVENPQEDYGETVKLFIDNGASMTEYDNGKNKPLSIYCLLSDKAVSLQIVKLLVEAGSDVNQMDFYERTPFYHVARSLIAAGTEAESVMKYLIDQGADLNRRYNDEKMTVLMTLAFEYSDNPEPIGRVMKYMIKKGADMTLKTEDGDTAYDLCASPECEAILIFNGYRNRSEDEETKNTNPKISV